MTINASTTRRQFFGSVAAVGTATAGLAIVSSGGRSMASGALGAISGAGVVESPADRKLLSGRIGLPVDATAGDLVCLNNFRGNSNANGPCGHLGVDIGEQVTNVAGRPLLACVDGVIERDGSLSSAGKFRILKGDDGRWYRYHHLDAFEPTVEEGAVVRRGDVIGTMGQSGNTGWTHLHFEVWINSVIPRDGIALDPVGLMIFPDGVQLDPSRACS